MKLLKPHFFSFLPNEKRPDATRVLYMLVLQLGLSIDLGGSSSRLPARLLPCECDQNLRSSRNASADRGVVQPHIYIKKIELFHFRNQVLFSPEVERRAVFIGG